MVLKWLKNIVSRKPQKENQEATISTLDRNDLMEFFTEGGEQVFLEREEYRKIVLPYNLQLSWDNPQELYNTIHSGLRDGFYEDILVASNRLLEIDRNHERSHCMASIVLMSNQRALDARIILENYIKLYGPSAIILTNLAKTYTDKQITRNILWQAIQLDPNLDHALDCWLALIHEREGVEGYQKALEKVTVLPKSWLAHMYLAFVKLEAKNLIEAMPLIQHVLNTAPKESQALFGLSGELWKNGYHKEIIELILPNYIPGVDYEDGVIHNILSTFYELQMPAEGLSFIENVKSSFKAQTDIQRIEENFIEDDFRKYEEKFKLMLNTP